MSRWSAAHRVAQIAAQRARADAELGPAVRVDVIEVITGAGVDVFGQRGRLFGALLPEAENRPAGIWLNAGLGVTAQRHTAAHEWGHYILDHGGRCGLDADPVTVDYSVVMRSLTETTAEAFAAWLLMPRAALLATLRALGAARPLTPLHCYETALVLGTSYKGTARHLSTAHLTDYNSSSRLMRTTPGRIKRDLDDPGAPAPDPRADIWRLTHFTAVNEILTVAASDRLILGHGDTAAVDALIKGNLAEFVAETPTAVVLQALAQPDRITAPATELPVGDTVVRLRVDQPVIGMADAGNIEDLTDVSFEELARRMTALGLSDVDS